MSSLTRRPISPTNLSYTNRKRPASDLTSPRNRAPVYRNTNTATSYATSPGRQATERQYPETPHAHPGPPYAHSANNQSAYSPTVPTLGMQALNMTPTSPRQTHPQMPVGPNTFGQHSPLSSQQGFDYQQYAPFHTAQSSAGYDYVGTYTNPNLSDPTFFHQNDPNLVHQDAPTLLHPFDPAFYPLYGTPMMESTPFHQQNSSLSSHSPHQELGYLPQTALYDSQLYQPPLSSPTHAFPATNSHDQHAAAFENASASPTDVINEGRTRCKYGCLDTKSRDGRIADFSDVKLHYRGVHTDAYARERVNLGPGHLSNHLIPWGVWEAEGDEAKVARMKEIFKRSHGRSANPPQPQPDTLTPCQTEVRRLRAITIACVKCPKAISPYSWTQHLKDAHGLHKEADYDAEVVKSMPQAVCLHPDCVKRPKSSLHNILRHIRKRHEADFVAASK